MPNFHALIPAAGSGLRAGDAMPKQYRPLNGKPMLWHALQPFLRHARIARIHLVLNPNDEGFAKFDWREFDAKLDVLRCGGDSRAHSVLNGLREIGARCSPDDRILVHDAARPCLAVSDIDRLIAEVGDAEAGGLLAEPVSDTLKRADASGRILRTEPREQLWRAQTPQMFRHDVLLRALTRSASLDGITDEASAVEQLGLQPLLVKAGATNLKVTYPEDFGLAEILLKTRSERQ